MKNFLKSFSLLRKAFLRARNGAYRRGGSRLRGICACGAEAFFFYAQRIIFLSRMRGMALTLDPACTGWRLRRRCIFAALHRATFVLCSFLSSLGKKETNQRKKPPTEINLPEFRGGRMLSRKCFRRMCRFLFGHISLRTTYGCETHPPAPTPAALSGRGIGKFITVGFIYRCSAFDVADSVYSQTQDTAPTRALLF